jgi:hypothetical protein
MKRYSLLLFLLCLLLGSYDVKAMSTWDVKPINSLIMDSKLTEKVTWEGNTCTSIITIPDDYSEKMINIVPTIFREPKDNTMPGDTYEYKIVIQNDSKHDYAYVANTFYIKPFQSNDNVANIKSYCGDDINSGGVMYRINSSKPLMALYDSKVKLSDEELSDSNLNQALINKGYTGIDDLDKYLLNYLNYPNDSLENHADEVAKILWPNISEMPKVKESNKSLIKFGYDYFYNKLFSMHLAKSDLDNDDYAIGNWMRDQKQYGKIDNFLSEINLNRETENTLKSLYFHLNGPLTRNPYVLFEFGLDFGFQLKRLDVETPVTPIITDDRSQNVINQVDDKTVESQVNTGVNSIINIIIFACLIALLLLLLIKGKMIMYEKKH